MTPDQINACFELVAACLLAANIHRLKADKQVRGVCLAPMIFMVCWGVWNCYFYAAINVPWSWFAGLLCTTINAIWVAQMLYYNHQERREHDKGSGTKETR